MKKAILPVSPWISILVQFTVLLQCVVAEDRDIYLVLVEGEPVAFHHSALDEVGGKLDPYR